MFLNPRPDINVIEADLSNSTAGQQLLDDGTVDRCEEEAEEDQRTVARAFFRTCYRNVRILIVYRGDRNLLLVNMMC